jgi:hypothetical protein
VEQAGTMGKRPAGPGHDRSPLDPIFGSGPRIVVSQFSGGVSLGRTPFSNQLALRRAIRKRSYESHVRKRVRR